MNLVDMMLENGLGNMIDHMIDPILKDEIYSKDLEDIEAIKDKICKMEISDEMKCLLEDMEACLMSASSRACYLAYLKGFINAIQVSKEI